MARLPSHLQATLDALQAKATDGVCQISLAELSQTLSVSQRTVRRRLRSLEELGYLHTQHVPGQPSIYRLTPGDQDSASSLSRRRSPFRSLSCFFRIPRRPLSRITQPVRRLFTSGSQPATERWRNDKFASAQTVGRQDILNLLQENIAKERHSLLVGPLGIGKSHILRHLATDLSTMYAERPTTNAGDVHPSSLVVGHCLYLEHISPLKPALMELARKLHKDGHLDVEGIEARYMEWEDVRKKLASLRVHQLANLVTTAMKDQGYVLLLDHLERVTPTMLPHLESLMHVALVIGATDELKATTQRLWWSFEHIEVPPLAHEEARQLLWQVADRSKIEHPQLFETRVLQQAKGNPLAIVTMAGKARTATLSVGEIRGLQHGAGTRYVSLTPLLLFLGALIVAVRFVALGLNDRDLYILAGLGYAFFFVLRHFIYRID